MTARGHFLYNSISKSLKSDLWLLGTISFAILYQHHWNVTYDWEGPFPLQFLIKIIDIWPITARGHFLYNSLSKSWKYDVWLLGAISTTIPYWSIEVWPMTGRGHFLYNSLSKSLKYDLSLLGAISITIPYQNYWHMTYNC